MTKPRRRLLRLEHAVPLFVITAILWHAIFRSEISFLISGLLCVAFLLLCCVTIIFSLFRRKWSSCLSCLAFLLLAISAPWAGGFIRTQIFLVRLAHYQKVVDELISSDQPQGIGLTIQNGFSDFLVGNHVGISNRPTQGKAVWFLSGDSSAIGHSGFVYLANDDIQRMKVSEPHLGFKKIAPYWYIFAD